MYSSSERGRRPASYWTSSSMADALTMRSSVIVARGEARDGTAEARSSGHAAQNVSEQLLERGFRDLCRRGIYRLLRHRTVVTEIGERRQEVGADVIASRGSLGLDRRRTVRQTVLQLE